MSVITERHVSAGHSWPAENCPACIAERPERPVYRRGDGLAALIALQLWIARQQDPNHCAVCGDHLDRWYLGFPFPLCCWCIDRSLGEPRLCCPPRAKRPCRREECQGTVIRVLGSNDTSED